MGTSHQATAPATMRASTMGCSTSTPAFVAIRPVSEGKRAPPACARTNMKPVLRGGATRRGKVTVVSACC